MRYLSSRFILDFLRFSKILFWRLSKKLTAWRSQTMRNIALNLINEDQMEATHSLSV